MPHFDMAVSYEDPLSASRMLSSSISSLSSSRHQSSQIAKAYRQAAQLFLTRRLPEALSTIEPVITPQPLDAVGEIEDGVRATPSPVAAASRGTRIKVWSFYLTFLNSVIELGPEEGKHAFGSTRWKAMVSKCRDGSIWDEIVNVGYGGTDGEVDAEVVINLATLLLTHSPSQKLTQQRLETYLSASSHPTFDISSHIESSLQRRPSQTNGTNTPRDLNIRLKLLELYTLHVLPRNDEWDYAREFISMSEVLDDERKEAFLLALHGLREEQEHAALREAELRRQQQEQLEQRRREAETRRAEAQRAEEERQRREDDLKRTPPRSSGGFSRQRNASGNSHSSHHPPTPSRHPRSAKSSLGKPPGFYERASGMMRALQISLLNMGQSMTANPIVLIRTLLFIFAFALAFGRRDLRERVKRIMANSWEKVRRTVGMGVKVSYI